MQLTTNQLTELKHIRITHIGLPKLVRVNIKSK
jgi:hypothetical protein